MMQTTWVPLTLQPVPEATVLPLGSDTAHLWAKTCHTTHDCPMRKMQVHYKKKKSVTMASRKGGELDTVGWLNSRLVMGLMPQTVLGK